jgi:hypothetical protein
MFIQFSEGMYALWKRKIKIVAIEWETGSPSLRVENKFNTSLRDSDVPRNIFRHEALTELINMTYSLKRLILNNWSDNSTKCPKHWWKFCEVEIRNFNTQNVGITPISLATEVQRVPVLWKQFTVSIFHGRGCTERAPTLWTYSVEAKMHNRLLCELGLSLILN